MTKYRIVLDSSSDIASVNGVDTAVVPFKIITDQKEYIDNSSLQTPQMIEELESYKGRSSTSCPNVSDWLDAFQDAEQIFCITITSALSGSYNVACSAARQYMEEYPNRRVFVFDSLSVGPEIRLLTEKLQELIAANTEFDRICQTVTAYREKTGLLFMLASMKNLAGNGRVNPLVAKIAGALGIRLVGKASAGGELEPLEKCRGDVKTLSALIEHMKALGYRNGKIRIGHCQNEPMAQKLCELLRREFAEADIRFYPSRGLCSFYAEKGGLMIGFEKGKRKK